MKILILAIFLMPLLAQAAPGYGVVTLIKGKVEAINAAGEKRALKVGDKVFESETVVTQKMSAARLAMMDTNVIEIYPNSNMKIQQYVFNPKEDQKNVSLEVSQGRIKSTVKQKYDNDKNKYNVKTPVIVAGVRGTTFSAEHDGKSERSRVVTFEGNVLVGKRGSDDTVREFFAVKANQSVSVDTKPESKPEVKEVPRVEQEKIKQEEKKEGFEKPVVVTPAERANPIADREVVKPNAAPATAADNKPVIEVPKPTVNTINAEEERRRLLEEQKRAADEERIKNNPVITTPPPAGTNPGTTTPQTCPEGYTGNYPNCTKLPRN